MMKPHYTKAEQIPETPPFVFSKTGFYVCLLFAVIGGLTFFITLDGMPLRAWQSFLMNFFFWTSLSLCGLFFVALQYMTSGVWSTPFRRVPEAMIGFLPVAFVLFLVLLAGMSHLYEWTHADVITHDTLLAGKSAYLNIPFFVIRNLVFFFSWLCFGYLLVRNSLMQDRTKNFDAVSLNRKIAAPFLVFFGLTFTLFTFDWLMSLEPHWFSTIFGVYAFAGLFESGLALIILLVWLLKRQGALKDVVDENHFHDLGKLMFAFCVFWAYIAFSQYMLIWYANLPEETVYMIKRTTGDWIPVALFLIFGKFILPFFLLLSRSAKRKIHYLAFVAVWVLLAQLVDVYWIIYPAFSDTPVFGWTEIGMTLGFAGLFLASVLWLLSRMPTMARHDPWILEALSHHQ